MKRKCKTKNCKDSIIRNGLCCKHFLKMYRDFEKKSKKVRFIVK